MNHAVLSASTSHRWINCPPSARLCEKFKYSPSVYADEGIAAHTLCEHKLKEMLGMDSNFSFEDFNFYNEEMNEFATEYALFCTELLDAAKNTCKDAIILIEQKLDFSKYVPDGFGTGDAVIVSDEKVHVVDFKYGQGVEVTAKDNTQMMCYALGALLLFDSIYNIKQVSMTIFQPRRSNISTFNISVQELYTWAEKILKPSAQLAYEGKGEFNVGNHCRFCKVKAVCKKQAEYNMELAKLDFKEPSLLENNEIAELLPRLDEFISWANDLKDYALKKALHGTKFEGFKLVEGRSSRKYLDEEKVASIVEKSGYDPYERKILGITNMTKMLGSKKFEELLGEQVYKPKGKLTLVPKEDKRSEVDIFNEFKENQL